MSYREWKQWYYSLPWLLRWFVLLILLRPVIDNFYYLKNISPFLSPLFIVGVLTPILSITAIFKWKTRFDSIIDFYFKLWTILVFISIAFLFIFDPLSMLFYEYFLRLSMPVYIYFFARLFIRSKQDLNGVLQTFLYSSLFVFVVFLYEIIVNPIRVVESRGLARIQGHYGDVLNYSIYLTLCFLISCYFYFSNNTMTQVKKMRNVLIVGVLAIMMLLNIHHSASYIVFGALVLLFISFNFRENSSTTLFIVMVIVSVFYLFGQEVIEQKINPLFQTDIAVYRGEKENDRLLHGRVGRWKMMWDEFSDSPIVAQFFGIPLKLDYPYYYISTNAHNDFFRIMMFTGFIGVGVYVLILINLYFRVRYLYRPQRFLALAGLLLLILYSITTTPTMYPSVLYIVYSVFAYISLPVNVIKT